MSTKQRKNKAKPVSAQWVRSDPHPCVIVKPDGWTKTFPTPRAATQAAEGHPEWIIAEA